MRLLRGGLGGVLLHDPISLLAIASLPSVEDEGPSDSNKLSIIVDAFFGACGFPVSIAVAGGTVRTNSIGVLAISGREEEPPPFSIIFVFFWQ